MPNKNYISGRNFEYRVKKYLESKDYFVLRSAGSHSMVDLLAIHRVFGWVLFIQCKHGKSNMDKKSKQRLYNISKYIDGDRGVGIIASNEKGKIKLKYLTPALNLFDYIIEE